MLVPKKPDLMGKMFDVRIVAASKFSMMGELLESSQPVRPAPADPLGQGQVSGLSRRQPDKRSLVIYPGCALLLAILFRLLYLLWIL